MRATKTTKTESKTTEQCAERFVVVRSYAAGVHCGVLDSQRDSGGRIIVVLTDARRVWRWRGANSVSELALHGAAEDHTRISEAVARCEVADVVEVHDATAEARANLTRSRWGA